MGGHKISIQKAKISPHLTFALKTSMIEAALEEVSADCPVDLDFCEPVLTGVIIEAQYRLPNNRHKRSYLHIDARAVSAEARQEMVTLLKNTIMLEFMIWLEQVLALPESSPTRQKQPTFLATYSGGQIHLTHDFM